MSVVVLVLAVVVVLLLVAICALLVGELLRGPGAGTVDYFMLRDREPADERERLRRVVRAAIEDWRDAHR